MKLEYMHISSESHKQHLILESRACIITLVLLYI